jgi:hypothetical protein
MRFQWAPAAMLLAAAWPAAAREVDPLSWFDGYWCTDPTKSEQTCELWGPARGGMKVGTSHTVRDGRSRTVELVTIAVDGARAEVRVFMNGAPPVPFTEVAREPAGMTFENPAHAYPQRIHYWRSGDVLHVEIMKMDGSQADGWDYQLQKLAAPKAD